MFYLRWTKVETYCFYIFQKAEEKNVLKILCVGWEWEGYYR